MSTEKEEDARNAGKASNWTSGLRFRGSKSLKWFLFWRFLFDVLVSAAESAWVVMLPGGGGALA